MTLRTLACVIGLAAIAPQVQAQQVDHPFYDPVPSEARPTQRLDLGRGPVDQQGYAQQTFVRELMPRIEQAVSAQLGDASRMRLSDLRTGRYQQAVVVCGMVRSAGDTQGKRFIARPMIATLETPDNSQAFEAGWRSTGCGA